MLCTGLDISQDNLGLYRYGIVYRAGVFNVKEVTSHFLVCYIFSNSHFTLQPSE